MDDEIKKVACSLVVLFCGVLGGLLPLRAVTNERCLAWGNCFAAGVFLSASLLHMLPDAEMSFRKNSEYFYLLGNMQTTVFLVCCGYLLVLLVEKVMLGGHDALILASRSRSSSARLEPQSRYCLLSTSSPDPLSETSPLITVSSKQNSPSSTAGMESCDFRTRMETHPSNISPARKASMNCSLPRSSCERIDHTLSNNNLVSCSCESSHSKSVHIHRVEYYSKLFGQGVRTGMELSQHLQQRGDQQVETITQTSGFDIMPYVLMIALCIHSFIAGLALGFTQQSDAAFILFVAIISHKSTASLALGISLMKANVPLQRYYALILVFSLFTPAGILLGFLVTTRVDSPQSNILSAVFTSLGSGTFLYIACSVIISEEFGSGTDKWIKFTCLMMGFLGMAAVSVIN
eukprot:Sdes_comp19384_c0_seq1m10679